jgi:hypothetical protein
MSNDRLVRFSDLLPDYLKPSDDEPVPLFSPTQQRSKVLPSLFSPVATDTCNIKDHHQRTNQVDTSSVEMPSSLEKSSASRQHQPVNLGSSTGILHCLPKTRPPQSPALSAIDEDCFFSPRQTEKSLMTYSPFSMASQASTSSFRSLPKIEMLSVDYIQNCKTLKTIQHIIHVLMEEGTYPSLLRKAKQKMIRLGGTLPIMDTKQQSATSATATANSTPSRLLVTANSTPSRLLVMGRPAALSPSTGSHLDMSVLSFDDLESVSLPHASIDAPSKQQPAMQHHEHASLIAEIERLTKQLKDMETTRWTDQQKFWDQLQTMDQEKSRTQDTIRLLRDQVSSSSLFREELSTNSVEMRVENQRLQQHLRQEQETRVQKNREQLQLETQLGLKVKELTQKLQASEWNQQSATRKNTELNVLLTSAQRNLQDIKKERDFMLRGLLGLVNKDGVDVSRSPRLGFMCLLCCVSDRSSLCIRTRQINRMSKEERANLLEESLGEAAACKGALQAMAETIKTSDIDRRRAIKVCNAPCLLLVSTVRSIMFCLINALFFF